MYENQSTTTKLHCNLLKWSNKRINEANQCTKQTIDQTRMLQSQHRSIAVHETTQTHKWSENSGDQKVGEKKIVVFFFGSFFIDISRYAQVLLCNRSVFGVRGLSRTDRLVRTRSRNAFVFFSLSNTKQFLTQSIRDLDPLDCFHPNRMELSVFVGQLNTIVAKSVQLAYIVDA